MSGSVGKDSGRGDDARRSDTAGAPRSVPIRDATIRLGQFLKLADLVDTGSDVKPLLADGDVRVNGEVETRRGRQLVAGDLVTVDLPAGARSVTVERADS